MKSVLALILALFAAASATAAPVPAADQTAIRAFLTRLYATYRANDLNHTWGKTIGVSNVFAPSTKKLWDENDRLLAGEGPGAVSDDVFCACNDFDGSLRATVIAITALPAGRINARVQVTNGGSKIINIQFVKAAAGWRVYDVELPRQGMLRAVLIQENADLSKTAKLAPAVKVEARVRPALSGTMSYAGPSTYKTFTTAQDFELSISGGTITGVVASEVLGRLWTVPVTGTYADGICTVVLKSDTFTGPCDAHRYAGQRLSNKGKVVGSFDLQNTGDLRQVAAQARPAPAPAYDDRATPTPIVWSLGRARVLVERGQRCAPEVSLRTPYCFGEAIDWLQRHPDKQAIDVVAMESSWALGSTIPYNSGQGWDIYRVAKTGGSFAASKQRHFGTQVRLPQGCMYSGVAEQAWFISVARGHKTAVEAARYLCSGWSGSPMYSRYLDTSDIDASQGDVSLGLASATEQASRPVGRPQRSYPRAAATVSNASAPTPAERPGELTDNEVDTFRNIVARQQRDNSDIIYQMPEVLQRQAVPPGCLPQVIHDSAAMALRGPGRVVPTPCVDRRRRPTPKHK